MTTSIYYFGWTDSTDRPVEEKVILGAVAFKRKHGKGPTVCLVNNRAISEDTLQLGSIKVVVTKGVLPNDFYFA